MADFTYFIIISDNDNNIKTLENVIRKLSKDAIILKYSNGEDGFKGVLKQKQPAVVILEKNLSRLNGLQLIANVRKLEQIPKHHMILINEVEDQKLNLDALKIGANDVLSLPFSIDKTIFKIRNAYNMVLSSNSEIGLKSTTEKLTTQLHEVSKHSVMMLKVIINEIYPNKAHLEQVYDAATWISHKICDEEEKEEIDNIELAAQIAYVGKIYLPENMITRPVLSDGRLQNDKMARVPEFVKELLGEIKPLEKIFKILYHIYENFDGSGIPSKEQAWKIPLGSRILRVCMDYLELFERSGRKTSKTIDALLHESKRLYDHRVIAFYDQFLASNKKYSDSRTSEMMVDSKEITEGMVLSRNIITDGGLKLMPAGQELTEAKFRKYLQYLKLTR
jgi:response regulator RpfG family c-di-GMP phosphodiesterase